LERCDAKALDVKFLLAKISPSIFAIDEQGGGQSQNGGEIAKHLSVVSID
jgi:hypothetical protein